jgi:hypothetical protein
MTAGHFGFAAGMKSPAPRLPLWALMLSTYLLDFVFIVLVAVGLESFAPLQPEAAAAYGAVLLQASYSHSLLGAGLIALLAALLASRAWGRHNGIVVGIVVLSHWLLDLPMHRADLPLLPGNAGNGPLLGLGLWDYPLVSMGLELALVLVGTYLYYQSTQRASAAIPDGGDQRGRGLLAAGVTGLLLLLLLLADVLALPLLVSVSLMLLLVVLCGWLDARLTWAQPTP